MFRKILIANRGEIAVRIIRSTRELGIRTVAVYSEGDKESMHVLLADEAVCIGPAIPAKSYLNAFSILSAACLSECDAIHPGYGFLSENAQFAELVAKAGMTFIGPTSEHIQTMANKIRARHVAASLGIPIVPGSEATVPSREAAHAIGKKIGYPLLIKAAMGGGGRGMKKIAHPDDLERGFAQTEKEAHAFFGTRDLYIEKALPKSRHVEVQILGDGHGNIRQYGLRDCSVQRRHQKLIEEAIPQHLPAKMAERISHDAVRLGEHLKYLGAGTVEFLVEGDRYHFIEMNTRIQVEHPVTEMVTQTDFVTEQIITAKEQSFRNLPPLSPPAGHAIECRINAEHPDTFLPACGTIEGLHLPGGPGVRVDTFIYDRYSVPPYYDALLAKIICWATTRAQCIQKMQRALQETTIGGIATNIPLHVKILDSQAFRSDTHTISFLESMLEP